MANQPIPVSVANQLIQNYDDYLVSRNEKGQTESISFDAAALMNWMESVRDHTDEFRIFLGVYDNVESKAGRITAIIWPYKDGEPAVKPEEAGRSGGTGEGEGGGNEGGGTGGTGGGGGTFEDPFNEGHLRP